MLFEGVVVCTKHLLRKIHREIYDCGQRPIGWVVDIFWGSIFMTSLVEHSTLLMHNFPINYRHPLTKLVANWVCLKSNTRYVYCYKILVVVF